jgi:hypothetical protein
MNCEAGLLLNCENPTPGSHFSGESTHEQQMTRPALLDFRIASDNGTLSDIFIARQARRISRETR